MPAGIAALPRQEIRLSPRAAARRGGPADDVRRRLAGQWSRLRERPPAGTLPPPLVQLVDELERAGKGVIMTMGKGGVGKTTVAAAIALELARRGHPVQLSTTDPAAHVSWVIDDPPAGLKVGRIDAEGETRTYRDEVMGAVGAKLDDQGRALLAEDLRSPCTEEVAVFRTLRAHGRRGQGRLRGPRYRADRAHHPSARRGRGLPPRGAAAVEQHARDGTGAAAATARSGVHPHPARDSARGHPGARGRPAPG